MEDNHLADIEVEGGGYVKEIQVMFWTGLDLVGIGSGGGLFR